jgi:hypothetical protein
VTTPILSPPLDEVTTALLTLLRGTGRPVFRSAYAGDGTGDGVNDANPISPPYWYAILYRILGGDADPLPSLDDDGRTTTVAYQVTVVSDRPDQVEKAARIVRDRVLGKAPSGGWAYPLTLPAGWVCARRAPDSVTPGIDPTGEAPNRVFSLPQRFLLTITAA